MNKVEINGELFLTTEFVRKSEVEAGQQFNKTQQVCTATSCTYNIDTSVKTNKVDILTYTAFNLETCQQKNYHIVTDMDIFTVSYPAEYEGDSEREDLTNYFYNDTRAKDCDTSFKTAFGITKNEQYLYSYLSKLINATAEWGLIRHSIEALNFCFVQPYDRDTYYLELTKNIIGQSSIVIIWEDNLSRTVPNFVESEFLEGRCVPLNPFWLFKSTTDPVLFSDASIFTENRNIRRNCPTYKLISTISKKGGVIPLTRPVKKAKGLRHNLQR